MRLALASRARACTAADRLLAITATTRNATSAIQFCASAIVSVPSGGRKKKLNASVAVTAVTVAIHRRPNVAIPSTMRRSANATVVGLTCGRVRNTKATAAIVRTPPSSTAMSRGGSERAVGTLFHCVIPHGHGRVTAFLWTLYAFLSGSHVMVGAGMHTATNVAPPVEPDQLNAIITDWVRLEHIRVFRQLLVMRCGVIALSIAVSGVLLGLLHSFAYWFSMGIFVLAPAGAWIVERRQERGLRKKVVKSS